MSVEAPERIWAYPSNVVSWKSAYCSDREVLGASVYVRADKLEELVAENEQVAKQRDMWIEAALVQQGKREDAEAALARALKALEPFALVAEHDISEVETDSDTFYPMPKPLNRAPQITVGHLRAARRALEGGE